MTKEKIKQKVTEKVNSFLKNKYIHVDGPYPLEEYGTDIVSKTILRSALELCFEETHKLSKSK